MPDAEAIKRLREHVGSAVLCRFIVTESNGKYYCDFKEDMVLEVVDEFVPGVQFQGWIPFGEDLEPGKKYGHRRAGIVDIRTKQEILYRNKTLEKCWSYHFKDLASMTLLAYGIKE